MLDNQSLVSYEYAVTNTVVLESNLCMILRINSGYNLGKDLSS